MFAVEDKRWKQSKGLDLMLPDTLIISKSNKQMYFIVVFVATKTKKWAADKSMQRWDWTVFCECRSSCSLAPAEFADH